LKARGVLAISLLTAIHIEEFMILQRIAIAVLVLGLVQEAASARERPAMIKVMGYLKNPGEYAMEGPTTILNAVGKAGGTARAAEENLMVIVSRKIDDKLTQEIRFNSLAALRGNPKADILLQPNDVVVIAQAEKK
jgi:protein involved in polysaccharide export with SLBB domain